MGTVIGSCTQALAYYAGPVDQEPSFAFSKAQYDAFKAYYALPLDGTRAAVYGDSDALPARWPSPTLNNWRWFGDPTPNKLRFDDLTTLWTSFWTSIVSLFNTVTSPVGWNVSAAAADAETMVAPKKPSLNAQFAGMVRAGAASLLNLTALTADAEVAAATVDTNTSLRGWAEFAYTTIRSCSYRSELDGSMKRFSLGEAALIVAAAAGVVSLLVAVPLLGTGVAAASTVAGTVSLAVVLGTLVVAYDWSYRCVPALPYQLADDAIALLTRTLWPAADWFFAIPKAADDGSDPYTNTQAPICLHYMGPEPTFVSAWCSEELGFADLGYNLMFVLRQTWPDALDWFNTTTIPIVADVAAFVRDLGYLDAFADVDMTDPVAFANYWKCATVYTALPNLLIALAYLYLLAQLRPLVGLVASVLTQALYPVGLALLFELSLLSALLTHSSAGLASSHFGTKLQEEYEEEEPEEPEKPLGLLQPARMAILAAARHVTHADAPGRRAAAGLAPLAERLAERARLRLARAWQQRHQWGRDDEVPLMDM